MEGREPSRTAVGAAIARAMHLDDPGPKVLEDRLARSLVGDAVPEQVEELMAKEPSVQHSYALQFVVRARYVEDMVERAVGEGVGQYVILGAGLDSFAYRRIDLLDRLRVYEVDHPASQAWKRARLHEVGVEIPDGVVFVPIDFERETLIDVLGAAGFDLTAPAALSWVAVAPYLTRPAIEATLKAVASLPAGTRMVMTYVVPPDILDEVAQRGFHWTAKRTADMGEPLVSLFTPAELEELVLGLGFSHVDHFEAADAKRTYLSGRPDAMLANIERFVTATV
jgi:methyltransferase (TIGR00027 family)